MARQKKSTKSGPTFEENLQRLEQLVEHLEKGDVALEESLSMYEEGVKLSKQCLEKLNEAEVRLRTLVGNSLKDFDIDDDSRKNNRESLNPGMPNGEKDLPIS